MVFVDHAAKVLLGLAISVPVLQIASKSMRIRGRDEHEALMEAKFHAGFWQSATEFTKSLNESIRDNVLSDPDRLAGLAKEGIATTAPTPASL